MVFPVLDDHEIRAMDDAKRQQQIAQSASFIKNLLLWEYPSICKQVSVLTDTVFPPALNRKEPTLRIRVWTPWWCFGPALMVARVLFTRELRCVERFGVPYKLSVS